MNLRNRTFDYPGDKLSGILEDVVQDSALKEVYYKEKIQVFFLNEFPQLVNDQLKIVDLKNAVLIIDCQSSSWREEIKLRSDSLINKINENFQSKIINSIKVV